MFVGAFHRDCYRRPERGRQSVGEVSQQFNGPAAWQPCYSILVLCHITHIEGVFTHAVLYIVLAVL